MERIRTLAELPFRIDFLSVGIILTILNIFREHKSNNSKIQAPLRILVRTLVGFASVQLQVIANALRGLVGAFTAVVDDEVGERRIVVTLVVHH